MTGLLPLIFALAILDTSRPQAGGPAPLSWLTWGLIVAASLVSWSVLSDGVSRVLARTQNRQWLDHWDVVAHGLMLVWLGWICYGLGWTRRVDLYSVAILPWVAMQAVHWWCLASGLRGRDETRAWSRYQLILHQIRFGMLPMLAILPVFDVCNWLTLRTGLQQWLIHDIGLGLTMTIGSLALGIFSLILMPVVMVRLWHAQPVPAGPLCDTLTRACQDMQVSIRRIMLWPSDGGRVYNAAVIGVMPRLRYVLFTQDLVDDLPPPQVLAVLGHELGHARYRHLFLYLLFALATLFTSFLLAEPATRALAFLRWTHGLSHEVRAGLATVILLGVKWRLIFGYLSRACERQADLSGAALTGDPQIMRQALRWVARLSGQPENAPSWRHYSIAQRAEFLARVAIDPSLADRHHLQVRRWWYGLIMLVLALAGILAIFAARGPSHPY